MEDHDGHRVDWRLETGDGKTATFSIDGRQYDLCSGALFLVSTKTLDVSVQQMDRVLSGIQPTHEGCKAFAEWVVQMRASEL